MSNRKVPVIDEAARAAIQAERAIRKAEATEEPKAQTSSRKLLANLKKIRLTRMGADSISKLVNDVASQSDRGAVILMAAMVEELLIKALSIRMRKEAEETIFDEHRSLYSFDSKIEVGEALNVFGHTTACNLRIIKELRNFFAHAPVSASFDTEAVGDYARTLDVAGFPALSIYLDTVDFGAGGKHRHSFLLGCFVICAALNMNYHRFRSIKDPDPSEKAKSKQFIKRFDQKYCAAWIPDTLP